MNIEITSVSKREQKLSGAGAAVYVLSQEDIRRSGATTIPDLLRIVPGVDVARVNANTWAISIRGFNTRYSTKVLVLIDGRSVYTPSFSGVYWDQQDLPLEDIDRIEVIRGPGGAVWGANAMNGVISIVTKNAKATQGGLLSAGAGSEENAQGLFRYGGKVRQSGAYRIFGRYLNLSNSASADGGKAADGWRMVRGGFRSDWDLSPRDTMTVQGDLYKNSEGQTVSLLFSNALPLQQTFNDKVTVGAGNVLGRWKRTLPNGSDTTLQVYYDRFNRLDQGLREILNTVDLDFQHHLAFGSRHNIVWGLGYRFTSANFNPGFDTTFFPLRRTDNLFSAFIQDEMRVTPSLWFTLGSKFEHNAYTGFEYEPSAQLVWTPTHRQAIWLSASRAIRQPSRTDTGIRIDVATFPLEDGNLGILSIFGNPKTKAEQLRDYEAGYRAQLSKKLSLDLATFLSFYRRLETTEPQDPYFEANPAPTHLVFPLVFANKAHARSYGGEVFANWNVTGRWRISPGCSVIHMHIGHDPSSQDTAAEAAEGDTPRHQFQIRSFINLPRRFDWDSSLYFVGRLPDGHVGRYARLDTRLGWRIGESVELSVVGRNLLSPRRYEFENAFEVDHTQVKRSAFAKVTWRF